MQALLFAIRTGSLFSIRVPYTWQSALTYPLLPPSAVIGLLANALQRFRNDRPPLHCLSEVEDAVLWAGARLTGPAVVRSFTTSAITKWTMEAGGKATNVLGRQYVFARTLDAAAILNDGDLAGTLADALLSAPITCGDSESLSSVEAKPDLKAVAACDFPAGDIVQPAFPFPVDLSQVEVVHGTGQLLLSHARCMKKGDDFALLTYFYPIEERDGVLHPSRVEIRARRPLRGYRIETVGDVIAN